MNSYQPSLFESDDQNVNAAISYSIGIHENLEAVQSDLNSRGFYVAEMEPDYRNGLFHLTIRRQPRRDLNALERTAD